MGEGPLGHENPSSAPGRDRRTAHRDRLRALELGNNVVIDFGLGVETSALRYGRRQQTSARWWSCATSNSHPAEQRRRLDLRQAEAPHTTWPMSDEELAEWAANIDIPTPGELDGSEPIERTTGWIPTWDEWRAHRWPPSLRLTRDRGWSQSAWRCSPKRRTSWGRPHASATLPAHILAACVESATLTRANPPRNSLVSTYGQLVIIKVRLVVSAVQAAPVLLHQATGKDVHTGQPSSRPQPPSRAVAASEPLFGVVADPLLVGS